MKKFTIGGIASAIAVFAVTSIALASPVNAEEAHSHVYKQYNTVAPTCTAQGYTAYRCDCGVEKRTYTSAIGHTYASKGYQTYSSSQHRMVRQCTRCGVQAYSYASHSYSVTTTTPTCTTAGRRTYRCNTCGYSYYETITAPGHSYTVTTVNATCTSSGYQRRQCTRCGTTTTTTTTSALGHSYSAATCTKAKACTRCGATSGSALGHSYSAATCTKAKTCTRCGIASGSALGHVSQTTVQKQATCTATGLRRTSCTRCGATLSTTTIAALGHNYNGSKTYSAYSSSMHRIATRCTRCSAQTYSYASHTKNLLGTKCTPCGMAL